MKNNLSDLKTKVEKSHSYYENYVNEFKKQTKTLGSQEIKK